MIRFREAINDSLKIKNAITDPANATPAIIPPHVKMRRFQWDAGERFQLLSDGDLLENFILGVRSRFCIIA